jgi:uncharacterized protein YktB (UPF0637 family)
MKFSSFSAQDFKVFDIAGFHSRMAAIREEVRPKLEALGAMLLPDIERLTGGDVFAHVAKHARRTVNPPDDTWVAFGPDKRGYKKHSHFKVAISRQCVRFLYEAGPEYQDKAKWLTSWKRKAGDLAPTLKKAKGLAWFKNEHDEEPAALLVDLTPQEIKELSVELTRTRDGQLVLGRLVSESEAMKWGVNEYTTAALATFKMLAPLYRLR